MLIPLKNPPSWTGPGVLPGQRIKSGTKVVIRKEDPNLSSKLSTRASLSQTESHDAEAPGAHAPAANARFEGGISRRPMGGYRFARQHCDVAYLSSSATPQ